MKVFILGTSVFDSPSGVGQYTKRLIQVMANQHPEDSFTFFGFRLWPKTLPKKEITGANVSYRFIRFMPGRVYNMLFRLGIQIPIDLLLRRRADIFFYPNFTVWPTLNRRTKKVVIVHDLSFIYFPQYASPRNLRDNLKFVPRSLKQADHVITISKSSKKQIVEHYKTDPAKISIVLPAVDLEHFRPRLAAEVAKIRAKYKLPKKYILYTGTLEPRKNLEGLMRAYTALGSEIKQQYGLVLAGGKGWQDQSISAMIEKLSAAGENIKWTGYVPDADLPAIYSGASLFAWPSFYEGFGIPPLEAMACGVPVITSDNSSLPEAVGDAAITVKAEDTQSLVNEIERVLSDEKLVKSMRARGLAQAKKFTWEKSAQTLLSLL